MHLYIIYSIIVGAVGVLSLLALVDAWYCRVNDYFQIGSIIKALLGFLDFISDLLFAAQLTVFLIDDQRNPIPLIIATMAAYLCIVLPMLISFMQLLNENKQQWVHSVHLRNWMQSYSHFLYMVSVVSGTAFTAIALVNSQAFGLEIFSMGLAKRKRLEFNLNRVWAVVACEV